MAGDRMAALTLVETVTSPFLAYGADVHDLSLSQGSAGLQLTVFAGFGASARTMDFDVSAGASFSGQNFLGAATDGFVAADFGTSTSMLSASRLSAVLNVGPGATSDALDLTHLNSGQMADQVSALGVDTGAASYLVSTVPNGAGLIAFQVQGDGSLQAVAPAPDPAVGQISDLVGVSAYGQTWVLGASLASDTVQSYTIDSAGTLAQVAGFGAPDGLGISTPTDMAPVFLEGQPYVAVVSAGSSSLSILRLEADGSFTAVDHVLDDQNSRFANATLVETVTVGDAVFVLTAGSDDGFSLFRLRPDGKLHLLASVADSQGTTLNNVSAAAMAVDGNTLQIFLTSATETGMSRFSYDISTLGSTFTGTSGNDMLTGGAGDDILLGGNGADQLSGGAGDDIIVDGAGADVLTGGAGADVFTFEADGSDDTITDFQRGIDALDLSFYPLLHDPNALGFVATAFGARLTFLGETLTINSSDGNPLSLAELIATNPFNTDRPAMVLGGGTTGGGQTQVGTAADNNLVGTNLDDILTGNGGDDVLTGGQGADMLMGGIGFDTASYLTATQPIVLDLLSPALNTGDAAGDVLVSIEAISGTGLGDTIRGGTQADTIRGNNGADTLDGRGGDDTLEGGNGADILIGGAGADRLIGGAQTDQASYATSPTGLRADLLHSDRNTGDGTGDTYDSIEDLGGSDRPDQLYGDGGANGIWGRGGDDWLQGRGGDDALHGGSGNDVLSGGGGADLLDGGSGTDRAQYFMSKQGVTASLANSAINTGDAAGDSYVSIEDLAGSRFADRLFGDAGANTLLGNEGDDLLDGAAGNDVLLGGDGADRLMGGAGNDSLTGGAGADVFLFATGSGQDVIHDFDIAADTINLALSMIGATAATGADVIADYGTIVGANAVFDFGGGDVIIIEHVSDLSALGNAFAFS